MKKTILLLMLLIPCYVFSQQKHIRTGGTVGNKYYVGSLPFTHNGNYHKLKVTVFGGGYYGNVSGTKTFSISSRSASSNEQIIVLYSTEGGRTGHYDLKAYKTQTGYDFVIETNWEYASFLIDVKRSAEGDVGISNLHTVNIHEYVVGNNVVEVTDQINFSKLHAIDELGRVGIGTVSPQAKLDVNGNIRAKEVKIEATGWADFVFSEDYKLPALSEVENHIKENKHLPDIPSESEVKENGVNIGEMQVKLLQKIEELTLYAIEQQKQINSLQEQLNSQKQ